MHDNLSGTAVSLTPLIQAGGEVATYYATNEDPNHAALGQSASQGLSGLLSGDTLAQLSADTVIDSGVGFVAGLIGSRFNLRMVWNNPSSANPTPVRIVQPKLAADPRGLRGSLADSSGSSVLNNAGGAISSANGKVIHLPPKASMDIDDAMDWMETQGALIPSMLSKKLSLSEQAYQAVRLQEDIIFAARNALKDGNAQGQLNFNHQPKTYQQLKAELDDNAGGNAFYEKMIKQAVENTTKEKTCFVAGTLVHTKDGLRPIEEIKVGDYVLSKPESGEGELAYKRVTRTYEFDDKEIWYLCFTDTNEQDHTLTGEVFATGDHPFWLAGFKSDWISEAHCNEEGIFANSWIHLQNIKPGMMLQLADGRLVTAEYPYRLIKMCFPELAFFLTSSGNEPYYYGQVFSFAETVPQRCRGDIKNALGEVILRTCDPNSPGDYFNEGEEWEGISEVKWFKHKVYNLEVADYHTYFVAKQGVWVHNANYGVSINPNDSFETQLLKKYNLNPNSDKIFNSTKEFNDFIKNIPLEKRTGTYVVVEKVNTGSLGDEFQAHTEGAPYDSDSKTMYNIVIAGVNPFGGVTYTKVGDAFAYIINAKGQRVPSNAVMDVKAQDFGTASAGIKYYLDPNKFDNPDYSPTSSFELDKLKGFINSLQRNSAFAIQANQPIIFANPEIAKSLSIEQVADAIVKAVSDPRIKNISKPVINPIQGWDIDNWFAADKIFLGTLKPGVVRGEAGNVLNDELIRFKWIKDVNGQKVLTYERVAANKVLAEAMLDSNNSGINIANNKKALDGIGVKSNLNVELEGANQIGDALTFSDITQLLPVAKQHWLNAGALSSVLDNIQFNIADLSNNIAAQTQLNQITLDSNGAGWGWFIDGTPLDSAEFNALTNGSTDMLAQAGLAADSKLDLLSVMIHEMGHALGLEHANDGVMEAVTQAGERHLLGEDEFAHMATLRNAVTANTNQTQAPQAVHYQFVANPVFINGVFENNLFSGWNIIGKVTANNGAAVLSEVSTSQTRLNQVFVVGADDRYLSFTLSNIGLEGKSALSATSTLTPTPLPQGEGLPSDAFEVALLNANTGASLTVPIGLTRTDALLNIQANGAELKAIGVTSVINADGSRTYVVDLAGIAAGTAVNLSFDLIGFGNTAANTNSFVTVRDVRLTGAVVTPQANDDIAIGAEDTVMQIIALANDLNIVQANASFSPIIVAAPTHGTVSINADGSFSYTPYANYFGVDSFTYQLSDSVHQSNVATVNLTVSTAL